RVVSDVDVIVTPSLAVIAELLDARDDRRVVAGHRAALAERAEVLRRIEAERRGVTARSGAMAGAGCAVRLRRVLEHAQPGRAHAIDVDELAEEMDRDDALGPLGHAARGVVDV